METLIVGITKEILIKVNENKGIRIKIPETKKELFDKLFYAKKLIHFLCKDNTLEYDNIQYFNTFNFYIKNNYPGLLDKYLHLINGNFEENYLLNLNYQSNIRLLKAKTKQEKLEILNYISDLNMLYKKYLDYKYNYL